MVLLKKYEALGAWRKLTDTIKHTGKNSEPETHSCHGYYKISIQTGSTASNPTERIGLCSQYDIGRNRQAQ
ncbi:hypothetical protein AXG93_4123s1040 [Marchantia polymorpha subsp. ruderalis]|uniref:Uncharacterized protein n=1 Tax=Marchantia polymorpha subsp. ruderalis TaxID=1480154 RepID=A0A176WJW3_MARPO|nr:hypothetical protein AXG93_4123s1040 [Marchantia polymorpha subsp. ruderalis]